MGYIFDPEVAKDAIGQKKPRKEMFQIIANQLAKKYPGHIGTEPDWLFNNAGGAMGTMWILHASITEYVIIFGSVTGTEGHSGRFFATDYFVILDGEQWCAKATDLEKQVYKPGDMNIMPAGTATQYRMPDTCFALEYARGFIPAMLPFGVADTLFSTLDFHTLVKTFYIYGKCTVKELLQLKI